MTMMMLKTLPTAFVVLLSCWVDAIAFSTVRVPVCRRRMTQRIKILPHPFQSSLSTTLGLEPSSTSTALASTATSTTAMIMLAQGGDGIDEAFTDSIQYLDNTIVTLLGVFGLVMIVLVGIKVVTDQTDAAIEQVLVDFEQTMKESYPQRWQTEIRPELEGLQGTDRQQRLVQVMETMEQKDPEFMSRVQAKMKR